MTDQQTIAELRAENAELKTKVKDIEFARDSWHRWASEVLTDFKIPFDNHREGLRMAFTQWMANTRQQLLSAESDCAARDMLIALWDCRFQKFQSWKANGVPADDWPAAVLADYDELSKLQPTSGKSLLERLERAEKALRRIASFKRQLSVREIMSTDEGDIDLRTPEAIIAQQALQPTEGNANKEAI